MSINNYFLFEYIAFVYLINLYRSCFLSPKKTNIIAVDKQAEKIRKISEIQLFTSTKPFSYTYTFYQSEHIMEHNGKKQLKIFTWALFDFTS